MKSKKNEKKISMITCYDSWSAKIIKNSNIDWILVGDSINMTMYGKQNTISTTIDMIKIHTEIVSNIIGNKLIISDFPFLSFRGSMDKFIKNTQIIMQSGANAIKIEGCDNDIKEKIIYAKKCGIPIMGHIGLTPQSINTIGGFKVQGKNSQEKDKIIKYASLLEEWGCFAIVLECVPETLGKVISQKLSIPVIGIGAGRYVDGQVLVFHDLIGLNNDFFPKFVKKYLDGFKLIKDSINAFDNDVKNNKFPKEEHIY